MRMNALMRPLWEAGEVDDPAALHESPSLPGELRDLIDRGWRVGPAGALLLDGCYGDGSGWRSDWAEGEIARHEFAVNDVGVPSDDLPPAREEFLRAAVARSREFAVAALSAAHGMPASDSLVAVVSVGVDDDFLMHGATVKFGTERGGFPEAYAELERFRFEAMAVVAVLDAHGGPGPDGGSSGRPGSP
ncbi:hypothetical protein [Streptomyces sp. NPDC058653]|uniref:hypothetical protein n=1 Tax=Streptomyces sp. NPDC058653 TaxID=3346576 RepID=UPI003647AC7D